jgi:hypothetical protein
MTGVTHVATSAALNYLGKVRALFESIRAHHPEFVCHYLVTERRDAAGVAADQEPFAMAFADDLDAGRRADWLFRHSLVELATALKPHFLLSLLQRPDCDRLLYFDPDIVLFSRLDDVLAAVNESPVVLTPHLLRPERDAQAVLDNEVCALRHGVFNLGFVGLRRGPASLAFLEWWRDRADVHCSADVADGLFTDQKWIDLAPVFFPGDVAILRNPRLNVGPWNLSQRRISGSVETGLEVEGEPLGFYHFSGFDRGDHHRMADRYASDHDAVAGLLDWYTARVGSLSPAEGRPWSLGAYDDGTPIADVHRHIYRRRHDVQLAFADPYVTGPGTYRDWLAVHGPAEVPHLLS